MKNAFDAAIVFAISIILLCAAAWAQPQYTTTDLGALDPIFGRWASMTMVSL
jgi:hypothetical protein